MCKSWQEEKCRNLELDYKCSLNYYPNEKLGMPDKENVLDVDGDNNCFYRAISCILTGKEGEHHILRKKIADYAENTRRIFNSIDYRDEFKNLIDRTRTIGIWGGAFQCHVLADMLNCNVFVYDIGQNKSDSYARGWTPHLSNHFNPIKPVSEDNCYLLLTYNNNALVADHCKSANHYQVVLETLDYFPDSFSIPNLAIQTDNNPEHYINDSVVCNSEDELEPYEEGDEEDIIVKTPAVSPSPFPDCMPSANVNNLTTMPASSINQQSATLKDGSSFPNKNTNFDTDPTNSNNFDVDFNIQNYKKKC